MVDGACCQPKYHFVIFPTVLLSATISAINFICINAFICKVNCLSYNHYYLINITNI
ncbi:hypothetical protein CPS_0427 [Colwellia psychrerythraea 34H]|uniref:Uncharacterized protein n=1 Tax=Colwellia psychrerythraea (strain 34H / ATCC BAA-681) TaxID=167879 RepID=Q489S9_COLP3|nr:hypothetical protein CPS_0427 [Colwellia psychrerythraea 34H]